MSRVYSYFHRFRNILSSREHYATTFSFAYKTVDQKTEFPFTIIGSYPRVLHTLSLSFSFSLSLASSLILQFRSISVSSLLTAFRSFFLSLFITFSLSFPFLLSSSLSLYLIYSPTSIFSIFILFSYYAGSLLFCKYCNFQVLFYLIFDILCIF